MSTSSPVATMRMRRSPARRCSSVTEVRVTGVAGVRGGSGRSVVSVTARVPFVSGPGAVRGMRWCRWVNRCAGPPYSARRTDPPPRRDAHEIESATDLAPGTLPGRPTPYRRGSWWFDRVMYFIVVKFPVKPGHAEQWPEIVREYTEATRAEPGNKWFEWSRSLEDPNEFVLVEAFEDDGAGPHVQSDHFAKVTREWP